MRNQVPVIFIFLLSALILPRVIAEDLSASATKTALASSVAQLESLSTSLRLMHSAMQKNDVDMQRHVLARSLVTIYFFKRSLIEDEGLKKEDPALLKTMAEAMMEEGHYIKARFPNEIRAYIAELRKSIEEITEMDELSLATRNSMERAVKILEAWIAE